MKFIKSFKKSLILDEKIFIKSIIRYFITWFCGFFCFNVFRLGITAFLEPSFNITLKFSNGFFGSLGLVFFLYLILINSTSTRKDNKKDVRNG